MVSNTWLLSSFHFSEGECGGMFYLMSIYEKMGLMFALLGRGEKSYVLMGVMGNFVLWI